MSQIAPKPIIARVAQTWEVPPGMKIALVEDMEKNVWIVESCPVGTHFWTLAQAQELPQTGRTGHALRAAITAGHALLTARETQIVAPVKPEPVVRPLPRLYREDRRAFVPRETLRARCAAPHAANEPLFARKSVDSFELKDRRPLASGLFAHV